MIKTIYVHFANQTDVSLFSELVKQPLPPWVHCMKYPWPESKSISQSAASTLEQSCLFNSVSCYDTDWLGMPEFKQFDKEPERSVEIEFDSEDARASFGSLIGQKLTDKTQSIWYPAAKIDRYSDKRWISDSPISTKYPIYIISKGRWESRLTSRALERYGVPYNIVVEPQEFDKYASVISADKIIILPFSNLGQGSIPARNFVWQHSMEHGHKKHWILDDNINGFYRLHHNLKVEVIGAGSFRACEDFTDRYENVDISGMNYFMFASRKCGNIRPFTLNTRVYSCILINNVSRHRWRGRYNEDTDLSIRVLKDGRCTILFNAFLCYKMQTMTMKGGNSDVLYQEDGRLKMAESLRDQHPDIVKVTTKWGRPQHHVDYSAFSRNKLILKQSFEPCNVALRLVNIEEPQ